MQFTDKRLNRVRSDNARKACVARNACVFQLRAVALVLCIFIFAGVSAADNSTWTGVQRIVAVGDVHGDFHQFVAVLRSAKVIDKHNRWTGGKTHLVQVGDVPDRGPDTRKVLDLLVKLEAEARSAGGAVHALIGNHEAMNVYGDLRYVIPEEFASFRDANSERVREAFYKMHLEELSKDSAGKEGKESDDASRKAWDKEHPLGYFEQRYQFGPNGKYGKWIESHNTIIRINETVFVHGGISPKYADMSREAINERVREELKDFSLLKGGIVTDPDGPLWYRGLARDEESTLAEHVDHVLKVQGARRIVIGHTPTLGVILPRFEGKVLLIDVGLSAYYGSHLACLVLEGEKAYAIYGSTCLPIPSDPGQPLLEYLKRVASLDPKPSAIEKLISDLEERLAPAVGVH